MKKSFLITLLCAVMCMATGVSIANGVHSPVESKTLVFTAPTAVTVDANTSNAVAVVTIKSVNSAESPVFSASTSISKEGPYAIPIKQGIILTYNKHGYTSKTLSGSLDAEKSDTWQSKHWVSSACSKYIYSACRPPVLSPSYKHTGKSDVDKQNLAVSEISPGAGGEHSKL